VTTPDKTVHKLWRMASAELIGKLRPLFAQKKLHVLDGHARYEGMLAYAAKLGADNQPQYSSANYGLGCLVNVEILRSPSPRAIASSATRASSGTRCSKPPGATSSSTSSPCAHDLTKQQMALAESVAHQPAFVATFAGDADAYSSRSSPMSRSSAKASRFTARSQRYEPVVVEHLFLAACAADRLDDQHDAGAVLDAVKAGQRSA